MSLRAEPGKQKTQSRRAQELARGRAREKEWQKREGLQNAGTLGLEKREHTSNACGKNGRKTRDARALRPEATRVRLGYEC
ncbi:MAG: hypothetical protein WAK48_25580 [Candidatus Acidiferrum sp.]|jgi:hypothetical protein